MKTKILLLILSSFITIFTTNADASNTNKRKFDLPLEEGNKKAKLIKSAPDKNYKIISYEIDDKIFYDIVPTEAYIRDVINTYFIPNFIACNTIAIKPYENDAQIITQVKQLPPFCSLNTIMPVMHKGRYLDKESEDTDILNRGYIICPLTNTDQVYGALHLILAMGDTSCKLETVGIDPQCQGQGFGSSLTQLSLVLASLYGRSGVELQSYDTKEALHTYIKHGFWFYRAPNIANGEDSEYSQCSCEEENTGFAPYEDLMIFEKLIKLGTDYELEMRFDFTHDDQLQKLDTYMERHVKPKMLFSEFLKHNITCVSKLQKDLDEFLKLSQSRKTKDKNKAREIFACLKPQIKFPQELEQDLNRL